tara:strand:- start:333 stop:944 length:612 start_codon:yes stop_codon:yes gene_type:complete
MTNKIVVFISGNGSNLQRVIDKIADKTLDYKIMLVVSNKKNAYGITRAMTNGIPTLYFPYIRKNYKNREEYDEKLAHRVKSICKFKWIVCLGWMHIFTNNFIKAFPEKTILNLHPALPGQFPGSDAIGEAYKYYKENPCLDMMTGAMVHWVIAEIDAGEVVKTIDIPVFTCDTLEDLRKRVQFHEKIVLINALRFLSNRFLYS